jgi:glycerate-2-kinase
MRILNAGRLCSHGNVRGRTLVLDILEAGLTASDPYQNTRRMLRLEGGRLTVGHPDFEPSGDPRRGEATFDLAAIRRILVVGAAKGVQFAAKAIEDVLGDRLTGGHVIAKHGDPPILRRIGVTYGGHPVPDEGCVEGCRRILELCHDLTPDDLVFTLVGNGISSLLTLPSPGLSLEDVRVVTRILQIERGLPTHELNPIRNHLDQLKGGNLTRRLQPAQAVHVLLYDPEGQLVDRERGYVQLLQKNRFLHTLPDQGTFADARAILRRWQAWDAMPDSVRAHLERADPSQETFRPEEFEQTRFRIFGVLPRRAGLLHGARLRAAALGIPAHTLATFLQVEAKPAAAVLMEIAHTVAREGAPFAPPCALLTAGELLVTVGQERGMGGRNQEYALAAALRIVGSRQIVVGAIDSDGTDGPGGTLLADGAEIRCLAGGVVDGWTVDRARAAGVNIHEALRTHDTSPALWRLDSGIHATPNISMTDLGVILILGRE